MGAGNNIGIVGSPPLAWGILPVVLVIILAFRITPTRMGNTLNAGPLNWDWKDHPHSHGEYKC